MTHKIRYIIVVMVLSLVFLVGCGNSTERINGGQYYWETYKNNAMIITDVNGGVPQLLEEYSKRTGRVVHSWYIIYMYAQMGINIELEPEGD